MATKIDDIELEIRQANRGDAEAILRFCTLGAKETLNRDLDPAELRAGISHILRGHSDFYIVAKIGEQYVGQLKIHYHDYDWYDAVFWWIEHVYVEKGLRGKGIAQAMLDHVVRLARDNGYVKHLILHVGTSNERAIRLYENYGFAYPELKMMMMTNNLGYKERTPRQA